MNANSKHREWMTSEVRFIIANLGKLTHKQIAEHLGRTPSSVSHYITRHLLPEGCGRQHYPWTPEDDAILLAVCHRDVAYVCLELGYRHSVYSIRKRLRFLRQKNNARQP